MTYGWEEKKKEEEKKNQRNLYGFFVVHIVLLSNSLSRCRSKCVALKENTHQILFITVLFVRRLVKPNNAFYF